MTRHRSHASDLPGLLIHHAAFYDFSVWLMTLGRERAFRERTIRLARLEPGESVLDIGCGTGSLAIAAKRHVGRDGAVHGIDPSPEMLMRAERKARRAGAAIAFGRASAQALPFQDAEFDVVLSTVMFHHLPRDSRAQCVAEMRRVLKPGGRALVIDFAQPHGKSHLFQHRHGHVALSEIIAMLQDAGLKLVESGPVGMRNLQYALAAAPAGG